MSHNVVVLNTSLGHSWTKSSISFITNKHIFLSRTSLIAIDYYSSSIGEPLKI
jgi:hypothetical protein